MKIIVNNPVLLIVGYLKNKTIWYKYKIILSNQINNKYNQYKAINNNNIVLKTLIIKT